MAPPRRSSSSWFVDCHTVLLVCLLFVAISAFLRTTSVHHSSSTPRHQHHHPLSSSPLRRTSLTELPSEEGDEEEEEDPSPSLSSSDEEEEDDEEDDESEEDSGGESKHVPKQSNLELASQSFVHFKTPVACKNADDMCLRLRKCNLHKWNPDESCKKAAKRCSEMPLEKQKVIEWCKACLMGGRALTFCHSEAVSCGRSSDHCQKQLMAARAAECGGKPTDPFPRELIANRTVDLSANCLAALKTEYEWEKKNRKNIATAPSSDATKQSSLSPKSAREVERRDMRLRANEKGAGFVYPELQY
ncbi:hypothetical protein NFJ02_33g83430 [Pycnococcus provasolii]